MFEKFKKPPTYLVFIVQAYERSSPDGSLSDLTTLELIDETRENALKRAKKIEKKAHYRVSRVIENWRPGGSLIQIPTGEDLPN